MERFFGFDLGDAESAVARLAREEKGEPAIVPVCDAPSFITAYARAAGGGLLIGESACYSADTTVRRIRFKSRFLSDPDTEKDIQTFAAGVLGELYQSGNLVQNEDCCFYIGCPAGWNAVQRERYREIFERIGYPPVRIVSESRAALISACQSRHLQVGYDIMTRPVLVVDVGSSTTDFAYIEGGHEVELKTAGEVVLGGGLMDELLLDCAVAASPRADEIREIFSKSEAWRNYCEFAARRLKEKYFADEAYWEKQLCRKSVEILFDGKQIRLPIEINREIADRLLNGPVPGLKGASFHDVFCGSLNQSREKIDGKMPELLFLTGGVSNLPAIRTWCQEAYPDSVVVTGPHPEFSVARGLAYSGRIDEDMRAFRREVSNLIDSAVVEQLVEEHLDELYDAVVDALVEPLMENAVINIFDRWRSGEIERLSEIDEKLKEEIEDYLRGPEAQKLLVGVISGWLKPVAYALEEYTMPICVSHGIPYKALNLTTYLSVSDLEIQIDARDIFAVDQFTWMINAILSVIVGLICGGNGIALITGGLKGILAGTIVSLFVLLIGQEHIEAKMMDINLPKTLRKLIPRGQFASRMKKMAPEVKASFHKNLENEKTEEISSRLVSEISGQIEQCLTRMAEVVEIPLG